MNATVSVQAYRAVCDGRDALAEQVRTLTAMLVADASFPREWKIGPRLAILFNHMMARETVSRDSIMALYYGDRLDPPGENMPAVWIMRLRKKLQPLGSTMKNVYGLGWSISPADKAAIRLALKTSETSR